LTTLAATVAVLALIGGVTLGLTHLPAPVAARGAVSLSARCPDTSKNASAVPVAGASKQLVPFPADRVLVCRYGGMNSGAFGLLTRHAVLTTAPTSSTLVRLTNAAAEHRWGSGAYNCPSDDTSHVDLYFQAAATRNQIEVQVFETGCAKVTNGTITNAIVPAALESHLVQLVGSPRATAIAPAEDDVPWQGLGATPVRTWAASSPLPACTTAQLRSWAQGRGGSAMSTYYQGVFVRNDGRTCTLATANIAVLVGTDQTGAALHITDPVAAILPSGASERLQIVHPNLCAKNPAGADPGTQHRTALSLRIGAAVSRLDASIPWGGTCNQLDFTTWPTIQPQDFTIKTYPDTLPGLTVSLLHVPDSTDGGTMRYAVTITNVGSTTYSPADCPMFVQVLRGAQHVSAQQAPLNCTGAGPIRPGAARTFDMTFSTPHDSDGSLSWFLVKGPGA
jgi:hypothetical protein